MSISLYPHTTETAESWSNLSCVSCKGTNPFRRAPPCDLITSQRPFPQIPSPWGLGVSTWIWGVHKHPSPGRLHAKRGAASIIKVTNQLIFKDTKVSSIHWLETFKSREFFQLVEGYFRGMKQKKDVTCHFLAWKWTGTSEEECSLSLEAESSSWLTGNKERDWLVPQLQGNEFCQQSEWAWKWFFFGVSQ